MNERRKIPQPWNSFQVRKRNPEVKRDAVLLTAAHLFLEHGYRRTSMSELARRLRITKPALYYYFQNKEEIVIECYRRGIAVIENGLDNALVSHSDGFNKVKAYVQAYATAIIQHEFGRCVAMLDDGALSQETRHEVRALKKRIDAALRSYIEQGMQDGSIVACDAKLAGFAIAGAVNWIGTWYQPGGPLTAEAIGAQFASLLTDGLRGSRNGPAVTESMGPNSPDACNGMSTPGD
ncbi:MAG TPA: TetR/AcrR family transcriptional regulator [Acidobacteriaceae bacterium]|nr:TetR/AcrR family transcriptional regulator [Acidobacteriaceae bacterium]